MILLKLGKIFKYQYGFTLLEILIAISITGLLATGTTTTIWQLFNMNERNNSRMTAIKQVETAIDRLRTDVQMAQTIEPDTDSGTGFPLKLSWTDWNNNTKNEITYSFIGNELERSVNAGAPVKVANSIQSIQINPPAPGDTSNKISITITASVSGNGSTPENRTFEVLSRTGT